MNIFVLAKDPYKAAEYHCDKHVVKMIVESAQLLSTTLRFYGVSDHALYKATHANHPCAVWVRQSRTNYDWLCDLFDGLLLEYEMRYGNAKNKRHKCEALLSRFGKYRKVVPNLPKTPHPKCMPAHCILPNVVASYRNYYVLEKRSFAVWNFSTTPAWFSKQIKIKDYYVDRHSYLQTYNR